MKNIFKFMSMALVASALMVACGDKDDENTDTTTTPQQTASLTVKFGTLEYTPASHEAYTSNYDQYGIVEFYGGQNENSYPFFDMMFDVASTGTKTFEAQTGTQYEGTDSAYVYYTRPNATWQETGIYGIDYYEKEGIQLSQQDIRGDWEAVSATINVTGFDLNTLVTSFTLNATMFDYYSWMYGIVNDATDCDTKDLTITAANFAF